MSRDPDALTEREKETLRLLLRGHDAKSIARHLGLSVHTINERLRDARRKLGVSTSREAARLLAHDEEQSADSVGDKEIGVPRAARRLLSTTGPNRSHGAGSRLAWLGGGMLVMSLIFAAAALWSGSHASSTAAAPKVVATTPKQGATIKPGEFVVSVTYDRPMQPGSYSFAGEPALAPDSCATPEVSNDGRTYSMRCTASPGRSYEVWFNRQPFMNFKSVDGIRAEPYRLRFRTAGK